MAAILSRLQCVKTRKPFVRNKNVIMLNTLKTVNVFGENEKILSSCWGILLIVSDEFSCLLCSFLECSPIAFFNEGFSKWV